MLLFNSFSCIIFICRLYINDENFKIYLSYVGMLDLFMSYLYINNQGSDHILDVC